MAAHAELFRRVGHEFRQVSAVGCVTSDARAVVHDRRVRKAGARGCGRDLCMASAALRDGWLSCGHGVGGAVRVVALLASLLHRLVDELRLRDARIKAGVTREAKVSAGEIKQLGKT